MISNRKLNNFGAAYCGIIFTLLVLPWAILNNPIWALSVIVPYVIWMQYNNKPGVCFVVISMALCIPEIAGAIEFKNYLAEQTVWVYRSIYLLIIVCFFTTYKNKRINECKYFSYRPIIISSSILLIATIFIGKEETIYWLCKILTVPMFFYSCSNSDITFDQMFKCTSLVMIIIGFYALLDYFIGLNPYRFIIEASQHFNADEYYRARGILGHSLVLTGVFLSFFSMLLIYSHFKDRIYYILLVFSIVVLLISGSRTSVISMLVIVLFYAIYILKTNGMKKYILSLALLSCVAFYLISYIYPEYLEMMQGRFLQNPEHRESGYLTTYHIFQNNILGVGTRGLAKAMDQNAVGNLILGFGTLDNTYLTLIACFGIFSPFAFVFYFYYMVDAYKKTNVSPLYRYVLFWFLPWILIGFSFTSTVYLNITLLYFGIGGCMFKSIINQIDYDNDCCC